MKKLEIKFNPFFNEISIVSHFFSFQGQYFSGSSYRIYLLGNPIIWWSNLVFLGLFLIVYFASAVTAQRRAGAIEETQAADGKEKQPPVIKQGMHSKWEPSNAPNNPNLHSFHRE